MLLTSVENQQSEYEKKLILYKVKVNGTDKPYLGKAERKASRKTKDV